MAFRPSTAGLSPIRLALRRFASLGYAWFGLLPFRFQQSAVGNSRKSARSQSFAVPALHGAGVGVDPP